MNATVMAIILVLIVVATVVTKKVPFNFVLFIVPFVRYFWALAYRRQVTLYWSSSVRS